MNPPSSPFHRGECLAAEPQGHPQVMAGKHCQAMNHHHEHKEGHAYAQPYNGGEEEQGHKIAPVRLHETRSPQTSTHTATHTNTESWCDQSRPRALSSLEMHTEKPDTQNSPPKSMYYTNLYLSFFPRSPPGLFDSGLINAPYPSKQALLIYPKSIPISQKHPWSDIGPTCTISYPWITRYSRPFHTNPVNPIRAHRGRHRHISPRRSASTTGTFLEPPILLDTTLLEQRASPHQPCR